MNSFYQFLYLFESICFINLIVLGVGMRADFHGRQGTQTTKGMEMVTWADVKTWKSDSVGKVVDDLIGERRIITEVQDGIELIDVASGWRGVAAGVAQKRLVGIGRVSDRCASSLSTIVKTTAEAQDGVGKVESLVKEAQSNAYFNEFVISDDGIVTDPHPVELMPSASDPLTFIGNLFIKPLETIGQALLLPEVALRKAEREARLKECQQIVDDACRKAEEVDEQYTTSLRAVSGDESLPRRGRDSERLHLPDLPRADASTEETAAWWGSMTAQQKKDVVSQAKKEINEGNSRGYARLGNMDGVEAASRSEINSHRVDHDYNELANKIRQSSSSAGEPKQLNERLDELRAIKKVMREHRDCQLYLYDPPTGAEGHKHMHAALTIGDVDKAKHVATFVPGVSTNVKNSASSLVADMENLRNRAEAEGRGSVAATAWIGYDCPPGIIEAADRKPAELGGGPLAKHLEGISDLRRAAGRPVHQTVIGHSYGSTTSSYGLAQVRPGVVDDYAVYGSPGVKEKASGLNVPKGHSYVMRYGNDFIGLVGGVLGPDPYSSDSGFTRLDPGGSGTVNPLKAHCVYLKEGSKSQSLLAKITARESRD